VQFGRKSEQISPDQLALWAEGLEESRPAAPASPVELDTPPRRERPVRKPLPAHLPREEEVHDLAACTCPACGGALVRIGEERSEQLDWRPATFFVRRHIRPKYACRACETITTAPAPAAPIDKGLPGPGLLAHVLTSKYLDHLPLYRQAAIFERYGVQLARSTLVGWVAESTSRLAPLAEALQDQVLASPVVHTDDTPVPVLDPGRGKTKTGRLWVYARPPTLGPPATVYHYTPSRARAGPAGVLEGYRGYLQADAYPGYAALYASGAVTEVGCWAHVRRKFFELAEGGKSPRAAEALLYIQRLYAVEDAARALSPEARAARRQAEAAPVLAALHDWCLATLARLPPKSELAGAIRYATTRWPALTRYLEDGRLAIDNNVAERALRGIALGRKNFLFAGSDTGGERAAIAYSVIASAKANGHEPFAYLRDVLARLPTTLARDLHTLLPWNWQPAGAD
jgi:transposase